MNRVEIKPDNESHWLELRKQDITSTDVAALFDVSPYKTYFELWHDKKNGLRSDFEETERTLWGKYLEEAIANGCAKEESIEVQPFKNYMRVPELRAGSSFDFKVIAPFESILEIKNVDGLQFSRGWVQDENGFYEAPLHIELQVQHQMLVSGIDRVELRALIGGNKIQKISRVKSEKTQAAIIKKITEFWQSIDAGNAPKPDYAKDFDVLKKLYEDVQVGKTAVLAGNDRAAQLAEEYKRASADIKEAEARKTAAKAELLEMITDSQKAIGDGFKISAGYVSPTRVEYDRAGYRDFRISFAKEKT